MAPMRAVVTPLVRLNPGVLVFLAVFAACLLGILSRPVGLLASIWPANAVLLALMLRLPGAARPAGWLAAAAAYLLADLLTGASLPKALLLNMANMVGVGLAAAVLHHSGGLRAGLRNPTDILRIAAAAALGGAGAGVIGGIANLLLFDGPFGRGLTFWWVTETANYLTILPVLLALPHLPGRTAPATGDLHARRATLLPLAAVILSATAALFVGGPGAIAMPVLALLWCGLVYTVFSTAAIALCFSIAALMFFEGGHFMPVSSVDSAVLVSLRLGTVVVACAPVLLAIVLQERAELNARLHHLANHDPLTGLPNRQAFLDAVRRALRPGQGGAALMMLDLDHFKRINDSWGHAAGDAVLRAVGARIATALRGGDIAGRLGGEEFGVLLPNCPPRIAGSIAERIRQAIATHPVLTPDGQRIPISASIGLLTLTTHLPGDPEAALAIADAALYRAKHMGRNRVVCAGPDTSASGDPGQAQILSATG